MSYLSIFVFLFFTSIQYAVSQENSNLASVVMAYLEMEYFDGHELSGGCCVKSCDPTKCIGELEASFGPLGRIISFGILPIGCKSCKLNLSHIADEYPIQDSFEVGWKIYNAITWRLIDKYSFKTMTPYPYYTTGGINVEGSGKKAYMTFYVKILCLQKYGISCKLDCYETVDLYCDLITGEKYCKNDHFGDKCQLDKAPCSQNPCKGNGVCAPKGSSYVCNCNKDYIGVDCGKKACSDKTCENGVCLNGLTCKCLDYFTGVTCRTPSCSPNYCGPYGTCTIVGGKPYCRCDAARAYGERCKKVCPNRCANEGICRDVSGTPQCSCKAGNFGPSCEAASSTLCNYNQCNNGGTCKMVNNFPVCTCEMSEGYWTGTYCEEPKCNLYTCFHGNCVEGKKCSCIMGYKGDQCEEITCEGYDLCQNGGKCSVKPNLDSVVCECVKNKYTGDFCELACPKTCEHGQCNLYGGKIQCKCNDGYEGEACNIRTKKSFCDPSPCKHGQCQPSQLSDYNCVCDPKWTGVNCDQSICTPSNCIYGVCLAGEGCQCFNGYEGERCEIVKPIVLQKLCKEHGFESKVEGQYIKCNCTANEAIPPLCEIKCNPACQHGRCVQREGAPACLCDGGYYGELCDRTVEFPDLMMLQNVYIALIVIFTLSFIPIIVMIQYFKKRNAKVALENKQFLHPELVKNMAPDSSKKIDDTYAGIGLQRGAESQATFAKKKVTVDVAELAYDF